MIAGTVKTLICGIATCGLLISPTKMASFTVQDSLDINKVAEQYSSALESQYLGHRDSSGAVVDRRSINYDLYSLRDVAPSNLNVETVPLKEMQTQSGHAQVLVSVTTHVKFTPRTGTQVYLHGEQVKEFESSATDYHRLEVSSDNTSDSQIVDDTIITPVEDSSDQQTLTKNTQTALRNTSSKVPKIVYKVSVATRYDYLKAIMYAEKWTQSDSMNPAFPIFMDFNITDPFGNITPTRGNNCTNFVSQALYTGGVPVSEKTINKSDPQNWTWKVGLLGPSYTWGGAQNNYEYMSSNAGIFSRESNPWKAWEGSVIYADWNNDGTLDHAMIVVGYMYANGKVQPIICQKSSNRHDYPFSQPYANATRNHPNTTWKVLQYQP